MKSETLKSLYDAIDAGDYSRARSFLTPDFRHTSTHRPDPLDADTWFAALASIRSALSEVSHGLVIESKNETEVSGAFHLSARHTGILSIPTIGIEPLKPTGKRLALPPEPFVAYFRGVLIERIHVDMPKDGGIEGIVAQLRQS